MQTSAFTVGPLRGMDQRWKPSPDTGMRVRDLTWDGRDGWKTSGGFRRIVLGQGTPPVNPYAGTGTVTSLHFFTQHNGGRAWLVYESGGALFAFNGSNRASGYREALTFIDGTAVTGRKQLSTPWQRTQSVSWAGRIYLVNGYDTPLVYDGLKVERAGFDNAPAAPQVYALGNTQPDTGYHMTAQRSPVFSPTTAPEYYYKLELGLGPILDTNTDEQKCGYRYKVTFVNERGQESPASAASALATFRNEGGDEPKHGGTPVGVALPVGGSHVVARRIYRTQNVYDASGNLLSLGFGDVYYFHSEVQDNVTTVMADILPDSFLGGKLDAEALGPWPVGTKYLASFKDTLFVAGGTTNEVRFSAPRFPEVFPPDNVMDIGDADLGPVTGLYGTRNAVVVVPNVGLCFLSEDGVYVLQGTLENEGTRTSVIHLSTPVSEIVKRINRSALPNACAVTYHRDKEAWWAIPTLGQEYQEQRQDRHSCLLPWMGGQGRHSDPASLRDQQHGPRLALPELPAEARHGLRSRLRRQRADAQLHGEPQHRRRARGAAGARPAVPERPVPRLRNGRVGDRPLGAPPPGRRALRSQHAAAGTRPRAVAHHRAGEAKRAHLRLRSRDGRRRAAEHQAPVDAGRRVPEVTP